MGFAWHFTGGLIDRDYTGNVAASLDNTGKQDSAIRIGDRIAQLIFEYMSTPVVIEVPELPQMSRSTCGLGSTGRNLTDSPGAAVISGQERT